MRTVDLFCGCGGMSLGFQHAVYNIVAAFENWPSAVQCYQANFKHPVYRQDLSCVAEASKIIKEFSCLVNHYLQSFLILYPLKYQFQ